jgi:hypothetical protein
VGAPFHLVDFIDSLFIQGIGPEPVNGIGREGYDATLFEDCDSEFDLLFYSGLFRHLG